MRRVVGFFEYGNALAHFEQLLKTTSSEQQAELEAFVGANEAFTIYANLARRIQPPGSSLASYPTRMSPISTPVAAQASTPKSQTTSTEGADAAERSGLSWAMALARIEMASMLAAFTELQDPYVAVGPTSFELPAYKELLLDGVATHYWALAQDPSVKRVTKISPNNPVVLAYTRRLALSRKMLRGLAKAAVGDFSPLQYRELSGWNRDLDTLHFGLLMNIEEYLRTVALRSSTQTEIQSSFVRACQRQLRRERTELRKGTAKVIYFDEQGNPPSSSAGNQSQ